MPLTRSAAAAIRRNKATPTLKTPPRKTGKEEVDSCSKERNEHTSKPQILSPKRGRKRKLSELQSDDCNDDSVDTSTKPLRKKRRRLKSDINSNATMTTAKQTKTTKRGRRRRNSEAVIKKTVNSPIQSEGSNDRSDENIDDSDSEWDDTAIGTTDLMSDVDNSEIGTEESDDIIDSDADADIDDNNATVDRRHTKRKRLKETVYNYDSKTFIDKVCSELQNGTFPDPLKTLPKRRIRKIIKLDPGVQKVSLECVGILSLAIQLFVEDVTRRAYKFTVKDSRKMLQLQDICRACESDSIFDFLIDIIPRFKSLNVGDQSQPQSQSQTQPQSQALCFPHDDFMPPPIVNTMYGSGQSLPDPQLTTQTDVEASLSIMEQELDRTVEPPEIPPLPTPDVNITSPSLP